MWVPPPGWDPAHQGASAYPDRRGGTGAEEAAHGPAARAVVHTGYWGCGAFGGNRVLMALLQVVAARMAGLERLVFHTGAPGGEAALSEALALLGELTGGEPLETDALLERLHDRQFRWGVSDGN